tara:strand:+ start:64 stop:585 length:522 start_codon:yes stop_codon:yes gene_type:complete
MFLVETNRDSVPVEDLGIVVTRTKPEVVTSAQWRGSICLKNLARLGAVTVTATKLSRTEKKPTSQPAQAIRPVRPKTRAPVKPPPVRGIPPATVQRMVNEAARKASQETAQRILSQLPAQPAPMHPEALESVVEQVVERVLAQAPEPELQCEECERQFKTKRGLSNHMRSHAG